MDASRVASGLLSFWLGGFIASLYPACLMRHAPLALMVVREAGTGLASGLESQSLGQFFRLTV
jgi:hypothetical protein